MKKFIIVLIALFHQLSGFSQAKYSLTGYIKDSLSSETLIGATISVNGKEQGVNSNQYGFYSITLPGGTYKIVSSYVGYQSKETVIVLSRNTSFNFLLAPKISTNEEVIVYSKRRDAKG
jgi:CarboxypepD_reg-like domain